MATERFERKILFWVRAMGIVTLVGAGLALLVYGSLAAAMIYAAMHPGV